MEFWIILGALAAIVVAYPYLRCVVKRLILAGRLRKVCRRRGYGLFGTHALWFLGSKRNGRCDFYIETPEEVFAVKLFGVKRRMVTLVFTDNGEYFIRQHIGFASHGGFLKTSYDGRRKLLARFDFHYRYRNEWEIKRPRAVLLVHPICREIRRVDDNKEALLGAGEPVCGATLYSLSRLIADLEVTL